MSDKLPESEITWKTRLNGYWEESIHKLSNNLKLDPEKNHRLKQLLCKKCFYQETLAGQAFTEYTCLLCETKDLYPNTAVPLLCQKCATDKKICRDCCASLKGKRKDV